MADQTKDVRLSRHALETMALRGVDENEVRRTVRLGVREPMRAGRAGFRLNLRFNDDWRGHHYTTKQVLAIVAEEPEAFVVVTVYTFYFDDEQG